MEANRHSSDEGCRLRVEISLEIPHRVTALGEEGDLLLAGPSCSSSRLKARVLLPTITSKCCCFLSQSRWYPSTKAHCSSPSSASHREEQFRGDALEQDSGQRAEGRVRSGGAAAVPYTQTGECHASTDTIFPRFWH